MTGELQSKIEALAPWFHNVHLPDGRQTAPSHPYGDFPSFKWRELAAAIPEDLGGWSVLDIGCNAGFYSIQLARRGAQVLGLWWAPNHASVEALLRASGFRVLQRPAHEFYLCAPVPHRSPADLQRIMQS